MKLTMEDKGLILHLFWQARKQGKVEELLQECGYYNMKRTGEPDPLLNFLDRVANMFLNME